MIDDKILEKIAALKSEIKLYPHQQRIVDNNNTSQIVAHGVGSGKTLTGIAKFEKLKDLGKAKKALVVAPAGLRNNFGIEGVGKFTNSTYNIIGNKEEIRKGIAKPLDPNADYNIVSYEGFRKNPQAILKATGADTVIYDEAHRMKNGGTLTTKTLKSVRPLYKNQISLTGSIVSNRPGDLYSLVDIASNGSHRLGKSINQYENTFFGPGKMPKGSTYGKAPLTKVKHRHKLEKELGKIIDFADYEDLKRQADMPGKKIKYVNVPLSKEQTTIYENFLKGNKDIAKIMKMKKWQNLGSKDIKAAYNSSIQARKMMNNIGSVVPGAPMSSPKADKMLDDIQKHLSTDSRNQVALFSQLINGGVDGITAGLKKRNIPYGVFLGKGNKGSSEFERQNNIGSYNSGKNKVIVISGAGGEGLSLKNTTMEGMLDPHYNPERMNQMEARGVRSGGLKDRKDRNVYINRYVSTMPKKFGIFKSSYRTPDEFIYGVANRKNKQNDVVHDILRSNTQKAIFKQKMKNFFK